MWDALRTADPKWPGTTTSKFPAPDSAPSIRTAGTYVSSTNTTTILSTLGPDDQRQRPSQVSVPARRPQLQRRFYKGKPSDSDERLAVDGYINYVKGLSGTYKQKYGYRTLMDYFQETAFDPQSIGRPVADAALPSAGSEGRHLAVLPVPRPTCNFGDEVGLVVYGQYAVQQKTFYDGDVNVDISADPITSDYARSTRSRSTCRPVSTTVGPPWATAS